MKIPTEVFGRFIDEGGTVEADSRGGVWLKGKAAAAWGNMKHMLGRNLRESSR